MDNNQLIKQESGLLQKVGNAISVTNKLLALEEPQLIPYRKGDKWGFCTPDKKIVIDCIYDETHFFISCLSLVILRNRILIINVKNEIVIDKINLLINPIPNTLSNPFFILNEWYIKVGHEIKQSLPIALIESDKVTFDFESDFSGKFLYCRTLAGNQIDQDGILGIIGDVKIELQDEIPLDIFFDIIQYSKSKVLFKNNGIFNFIEQKKGYKNVTNEVEYWED